MFFRHWKSPHLITHSSPERWGYDYSRENSTCPLHLFVPLSLKVPGKLPCPPGWNVTKINRNLIHGTMIYLEKIMCLQKVEVDKDSLNKKEKKVDFFFLWAPYL